MLPNDWVIETNLYEDNSEHFLMKKLNGHNLDLMNSLLNVISNQIIDYKNIPENFVSNYQ